MSEAELEHLRAAASRTDYLSMARLAVALYERGHTDREVIRSCYGIEFPDEFFVIARSDRLELSVDCVNLPWQLAIPPELGGPTGEPYSTWPLELRAFDLEPRLVPLVELSDDDAVHGGSLLCYHLDEIEAGRTTILGLTVRYGSDVDPGFDEDAVPVLYGPSLLAVLHEYESDCQRMIEAQYNKPSNVGGFGYISAEYVAERRVHVERIEELQRRLASME